MNELTLDLLEQPHAGSWRNFAKDYSAGLKREEKGHLWHDSCLARFRLVDRFEKQPPPKSITGYWVASELDLQGDVL